MLQPKHHEKWKYNMMLHLEAICDDLITMIKNGPIKITQAKGGAYLVIDGRDAKAKELATDKEKESQTS